MKRAEALTSLSRDHHQALRALCEATMPAAQLAALAEALQQAEATHADG
jgi:phosphoserine aminotransferase